MKHLDSWSTLVINLDRSTDRLQAITQRFANLKIPFQRITAVDGQLLNKQDLEQTLDARAFRLKHGKHPAAGEVGCYLSHVQALITFLKLDTQYALILEDDVAPPDNLADILRALEDYTHRWDVVKLSGVHHGTPIKITNIDSKHHLCVMLTQCTGSSAYAINRRAAQRYLEKLLPMSLPFDHEFDQGWKYRLRIRYLTPFPFEHQQHNETTIQTTSTRKLHGLQRLPKHIYRASLELRRITYNTIDAIKSILTRH